MNENDRSDHDQRFKTLLEVFWSDLLRLMAPHHAAKIEGEPEFWRQEHFTDLPQGERRSLDIVAKVRAAGEEEFVLVHVEVEGQYRSEFPERMWQYFMQLFLRHGRPVLPLAIYLKGGPPGLQVSESRLSFLGEEISRFRFYSLGLSGASAEDFLARPEALAVGLASLMRFSRGSPAEHKLACFRRLATQGLKPAQQMLLLDCVQAYLPLEGALYEEFQDLLQNEPQPEVRNMELSWSEKLREEGREEGREEERRAALGGFRALFLRACELRGLSLSEAQREMLSACDDRAQLQSWNERALTATSSDEIFQPSAP
jgi:hypothetical protein